MAPCRGRVGLCDLRRRSRWSSGTPTFPRATKLRPSSESRNIPQRYPQHRPKRRNPRVREGRCISAREVHNRRSAPVAQRIRASDFGSEGWGFESLRARYSRKGFRGWDGKRERAGRRLVANRLWNGVQSSGNGSAARWRRGARAVTSRRDRTAGSHFTTTSGALFATDDAGRPDSTTFNETSSSGRTGKPNARRASLTIAQPPRTCVSQRAARRFSSSCNADTLRRSKSTAKRSEESRRKGNPRLSGHRPCPKRK